MQDQNRELIDIAHEAEIIRHMYPEVAGLLRRAVYWLETVRNVTPEIICPCPTPEERRRDLREAQNGVAILTKKIAVWPNRIERLAVAIAERWPEYAVELRYIGPCLNPPWHEIQGFDWQEAVKELRRVWAFATHKAAVADESGDAADGGEVGNESGLVDRQSQNVTAKAGDDFRSMNWYGTIHEFTPTQAACIRVLWEHWKQETPTVGEQTILESAESNSPRLRDVFKNHAAWGTMIVPANKGAFKLEPPTE